MHHVCWHIVPKILPPDQNKSQMTLAGDIFITVADQGKIYSTV